MWRRGVHRSHTLFSVSGDHLACFERAVGPRDDAVYFWRFRQRGESEPNSQPEGLGESLRIDLCGNWEGKIGSKVKA